jgi:hypothetical protein
MMGIATDLARGKMYDIEEQLLKDGFTDTDQSQSDFRAFDQEGWPNIYYSYKVEQIEMPGFDELQAMMQGKARAMAGSGSGGSGFGSGYGSGMGSQLGSGNPYGGGSADQVAGFQNSMLGGMMGMMGMFGGSGAGAGATSGVAGAQGGAFIQMYYSLFQQILKVTLRKVSLTVKWKVLGRDRDMKVVAFFTDPAAMDKVLSGMGSQDLSATGSGSGSGSGSGLGSGSGSGSGSKTTGGRP